MAETRELTLMFYFASDNPLAPLISSQLKARKQAGFHTKVTSSSSLLRTASPRFALITKVPDAIQEDREYSWSERKSTVGMPRVSFVIGRLPISDPHNRCDEMSSLISS